jgi:two-component system CheB/CheR fusion protein
VPLVGRVVETLQPLAGGQRIEVDTSRAGGDGAGPLVVRGDAGRLEQVLLNVIENAIIHAAGTERIDVRVRRTAGRDGRSDQAEIEVQDYGPGIPAADLPHLFSRFYTVEGSGRRGRDLGDLGRRSGLGLGLYIAREIVVAHSGTIEVHSTEGQGTTFSVRLPLTRPAQGTPPHGRSGSDVQESSRRGAAAPSRPEASGAPPGHPDAGGR